MVSFRPGNVDGYKPADKPKETPSKTAGSTQGDTKINADRKLSGEGDAKVNAFNKTAEKTSGEFTEHAFAGAVADNPEVLYDKLKSIRLSNNSSAANEYYDLGCRYQLQIADIMSNPELLKNNKKELDNLKHGLQQVITDMRNLQKTNTFYDAALSTHKDVFKNYLKDVKKCEELFNSGKIDKAKLIQNLEQHRLPDNPKQFEKDIFQQAIFTSYNDSKIGFGSRFLSIFSSGKNKGPENEPLINKK